jgi:hypothetical protein
MGGGWLSAPILFQLAVKWQAKTSTDRLSLIRTSLEALLWFAF